MKKFAAIFSVLLLSFCLNTSTVMASHISIPLTEGIYTVKDLNLMENVSYHVSNTSQGTVFYMVVDSNMQIFEARLLDKNSLQYTIGPFRSSSKIVVLGSGTMTIVD